MCGCVLEVGGPDVMKKRAERFGATSPATSTTVVTLPVTIVVSPF